MINLMLGYNTHIALRQGQVRTAYCARRLILNQQNDESERFI